MPKQIRMPKLSDTMEEGRLIAWRKSVGDPVKRGEILAEIETDKADMEFESFAEGTIASLAIEPGATVNVGTLIAVIALPGEEVADALSAVQAAPVAAPAASVAPAAAAPAPAAAPVAAAAPAASLAPASPVIVRSAPSQAPIVVSHVDDGRIRATPAARRLAEERSVDLSELDGTGPAGAIVNADVEAYLAELDRTEPPKEGPRATPVAQRMAEELGVDLDTVKGSGPAGRITKSDLLDHSKNEALRLKDREAELFAGAVELSQKRKALIRNMVQSKAEAPHFYLQMDAQTDSLRELRDRVNGEGVEGRPRVTYTHLMIKASALALERFPEANATYRSDEHNIALFDAINIGLAVDVNDELVAPTIKDCQGKGIFQLVGEANELIQRARMRKLQPQDYADGTFTISNLGMFGVSRFYAIITPPQSSILSVSAIEPRPVVRDGKVAISTMTTLGLSVDHRVLDGVKAAQFLAELKRLLEEPEELLRDEAGFGD